MKSESGWLWERNRARSETWWCSRACGWLWREGRGGGGRRLGGGACALAPPVLWWGGSGLRAGRGFRGDAIDLEPPVWCEGARSAGLPCGSGDIGGCCADRRLVAGNAREPGRSNPGAAARIDAHLRLARRRLDFEL